MEKLYQKIKEGIIPTKKNNYRPYFLLSRYLLILILVLFFIKIITLGFICFFPKTNFFAVVSRSVLLSLTNQRRSSSGITILKENSKLNQAAYLKAKDMLRYDYFAHTSPSGKSPWYWLGRTGYNYQYAGENLAIDFVDSHELFQAWYASSTHRANIINSRFKEIGMAVTSGEFKGRKTTVVVQYFGTQLAVPPAWAKELPQGTSSKSTSKSTQQTQGTYVYQPRYVSTPGGMTLYDYYRKNGQSLPSISQRAKLYEKLGLGNSSSYYGAGWQNALLLNKLLELDKKKESVAKTQKKEITQKEETSDQKKTITPTPTETSSSKAKKIPEEEEVSEEEKKPSYIISSKKKEKSFALRTIEFFAHNYDSITRTIFLSVFAIVFLSLCIDIFVKVKIQHKDIILRGTIYSLILLALFLLDKVVILKLIPHNLGIL